MGMFLVGAAGVLVGLGLVGIGIALGVGGDWGEGGGMAFVGAVAALTCSAICAVEPAAWRPARKPPVRISRRSRSARFLSTHHGMTGRPPRALALRAARA